MLPSNNTKTLKTISTLTLVAALLASFAVLAQTSSANPAPESNGSIVVAESPEALERFNRRNGLPAGKSRALSHTGKKAARVDAPAHELQPVPGVTVQPNYRYKPTLAANDPIHPQWYTDKIAAPKAWDTSTGASTVTVGVLDTGFGLNHEDLKDRWYNNPGEWGATTQEGPAPNCTSRSLALDKSCNNRDDDGNGYTDDYRGWDIVQTDNLPSAGSTNPSGAFVSHGTIVAGMVGATGNNGVGVASLNWGARLLPVQVLNDDGEGYSDVIGVGIRYATDMGAKVINLSLGAPQSDAYMKDAISYAVSRGVVVVAAAGNTDCDCIIYPANYPEVVAVGASDANDARASFSSYGANLDVVAPGSGTIRTTHWSSSNQTTLYTTSAYGTSIASPVVAGLAATLRGILPSASRDDIIGYIRGGADKVAGMGGATFTKQYGYGRINAATSSQINLSAYSAQSAYPSLKPGSSAEVFISYKNAGNTVWYDDTGLTGAPAGTKPVHLATSRLLNRKSVFGSAWGGDQNRAAVNFAAVYEADGTTPAVNQHAAQPGQIAKFAFTMTAPASMATGTYREFFQPIVEGGSVMNDPGTFMDVKVEVPFYASKFRAQAPYPSIIGDNAAHPLWLEYTNTGNTAWYDDTSLSGAPAGTKPVHLATSRLLNRWSGFGAPWSGDQNRPSLNFARVYRTDGTLYETNPHIVAPGESARFEFDVRGPFWGASNTYREFFQPIVEGGSTMNDPGTFLDIKLTKASYTSQYAGQCAYPTLSAGGTAVTCSLRYKNTGNAPWYDDNDLSAAPPDTKPLHLATTRTINRRSIFGSSWGGDQNRPALNFSKVFAADGTTEIVGATKVEPGQIAELSFQLSAPAGMAPGTYREFFQPIIEGRSTMNDPGTFLDITVQ